MKAFCVCKFTYSGIIFMLTDLSVFALVLFLHHIPSAKSEDKNIPNK